MPFKISTTMASKYSKLSRDQLIKKLIKQEFKIRSNGAKRGQITHMRNRMEKAYRQEDRLKKEARAKLKATKAELDKVVAELKEFRDYHVSILKDNQKKIQELHEQLLCADAELYQLKNTKTKDICIQANPPQPRIYNYLVQDDNQDELSYDDVADLI